MSLERTPAADMIAGTALAWTEVVADGREFDQALDAPRFRTAFRTLAATHRHWPAPRDFVEALGSTRREVPALTKQHIPARPEVVAAAAAEIAEAFRMDGKTAAAGPDA